MKLLLHFSVNDLLLQMHVSRSGGEPKKDNAIEKCIEIDKVYLKSIDIYLT